MKKTFLILASVALLASCNSGSQKENNNSNDSAIVVQETVTTEEVAVPDASNAQNSLDYQGTYKGVLPAADAEGIQTTITLGDNEYTKEILYLGKETKATKTSGKYKWNDNGTIITLEGEEKPNQYFVGENTLTQLDIDGNKITGDLASHYVLKKQ